MKKTYLNVAVCERERERGHRSHLTGQLPAGQRRSNLLLRQCSERSLQTKASRRSLWEQRRSLLLSQTRERSREERTAEGRTWRWRSEGGSGRWRSEGRGSRRRSEGGGGGRSAESLGGGRGGPDHRWSSGDGRGMRGNVESKPSRESLSSGFQLRRQLHLKERGIEFFFQLSVDVFPSTGSLAMSKLQTNISGMVENSSTFRAFYPLAIIGLMSPSTTFMPAHTFIFCLKESSFFFSLLFGNITILFSMYAA